MDGTDRAWLEFACAVIALGVVRKRSASEDVDAQLERADDELTEATVRLIKSLEHPHPFSVIAHNAALSPDDAGVLALAMGVEADAELQRLVAHLHDDTRRLRLTVGLLGSLVPGGASAVAPESRLRRAGFVELVADGPWSNQVVAVHPTVLWALAGEAWSPEHLPLGVEVLEHGGDDSGETLVAVTGPDKTRRVQQAAISAFGARFLVSPEPASPDEWNALVRQATILGVGLIVELGDHLAPGGRRVIERADHLAWALTSPLDLPLDEMPARLWSDVEASAHEPTDQEWTATLGDIPRTHRLTADQLRKVQRANEASGGDLDRAVRRLAGGAIDRLARRIRPSRTWDDIVLSPGRMTMLREVVDEYRHADVVYDRWGISSKPSRGQVALFSGPSGTGKSLASEIIAGELGLDLYKVDLASVVSKYIGETEENLDRVFDAASAGNIVLFFDEADALFGKRSEVNDARDRYANIEVSYLLQRLESYEGLVTLATNLEKNIDHAFLRRIHVAVQFAMPDVGERRLIWEHNLPASAPIAADVDLDFLAERFDLSGGSIRNAARKAAFVAAAGSGTIDMTALVFGVFREFQKVGRLVRASDFGLYADSFAR